MQIPTEKQDNKYLSAIFQLTKQLQIKCFLTVCDFRKSLSDVTDFQLQLVHSC